MRLSRKREKGKQNYESKQSQTRKPLNNPNPKLKDSPYVAIIKLKSPKLTVYTTPSTTVALRLHSFFPFVNPEVPAEDISP